VELPLTHPELYEEMGIRPPKGVILYGPPGTGTVQRRAPLPHSRTTHAPSHVSVYVCVWGAPGKTLLAKAVANQTSATFLRVVGSELIQKYLGDGPKLVRELFRVAEENAPSIVFIDEIDAVGTKRYTHTHTHKESQVHARAHIDTPNRTHSPRNMHAHAPMQKHARTPHLGMA
jgi:26S proteasome regulatory subunit T2